MTARAYLVAMCVFGALSVAAVCVLLVATMSAPSALTVVYGSGPLLFFVAFTVMAWRCRKDVVAAEAERDLKAANEREDRISQQ